MKKKAVRKAATKNVARKASSEKQTMHGKTSVRVSKVRDLSPKQIKKIRENEKVSQPIFAAWLNISSSTIKKWETGEKNPQGASLKLLNVIAEKGLEALA